MLFPRAPPQNVERILCRQRGPIGSVAGERFEGVSDREDPRFVRNLITYEAVRVSATVDAFMMTTDLGSQILEGVDRRHDVGAEPWVLLDLVELPRRQLSGFEQDL